MLPGDRVRMKVCVKPERWVYGEIVELTPGARYPIAVVWEDNGVEDWYDETEIQCLK